MGFKSASPVRAELVLLAACALILAALARATFDYVAETQDALAVENSYLRSQLGVLRSRAVFAQSDDDALRKWNVAQAELALQRHQTLFDAVLDVKRDLTNLQVRYKGARQ